jgi:hypothetical protein
MDVCDVRDRRNACDLPTDPEESLNSFCEVQRMTEGGHDGPTREGSGDPRSLPVLADYIVHKTGTPPGIANIDRAVRRLRLRHHDRP